MIANRKIVAVIPVREPENSKLRLASVLSADERAELTRALLKRVVAAADASFRISEVIVVASKPESVSGIVTSAPFSKKISTINESVFHGGVVSAMADGMDLARRNIDHDPRITRSELCLLLAPSDLPLVSARALDEAAGLLDEYELVINPSSRSDGTSLLLFRDKVGSIPLHYDDNSFEKHLQEASTLNLKYKVIEKEEFSFDLDSQQDLEKLKTRLHANSLSDVVLAIEQMR